MVPTSCSGFDLFLQSNQDRSLCDRERRKIGTEVLDMVVLSPEQPTICELIAIIASNLAVGCWCDCCSRVVHAFIKARGGTTSNRQKSSCTVLESNLPHSSPRCETADILHRNKSRGAECHIASSISRVSLGRDIPAPLTIAHASQGSTERRHLLWGRVVCRLLALPHHQSSDVDLGTSYSV
jgi:hypothetical protein